MTEDSSCAAVVGDHLVLVTDLDGTLLAGSEAHRRTLRELVLEEKNRISLVFATGRGIDTIVEILADPLVAAPRYIIADVGATVVRGDTLEPVLPLQHEIAACWPGTDTVLKRLAGFPSLKMAFPCERRCGFSFHGPALDPAIVAETERMGCSYLVTGDDFVEVLPRGVSKGTTLVRLLAQEDWSCERIVVAGDSMNDLSLFEQDVRGIVVGNAQPRLVERVAGRPGVFFSTVPGAGGILDGLAALGLEVASRTDSAEDVRWP
ncbi:MAG: HAD-IIB family hydrolase [Pseudomonadota bacterium]